MARVPSRLLLILSLVLLLGPPGGGAPGDTGSNKAPPARTDRYGDRLPAGSIARLGTLRYRGSDELSTAVLAPNGVDLVAASRDGKLSLLYAHNGMQRWRSQITYRDGLSFLALSPDAKVVVTEGPKSGLYLWTLPFFGDLHHLKGPIAKKRSVVFSADGKLLASASGEDLYETHRIHVWEVESGKRILNFKLDNIKEVQVRLSPNGQVLATWGRPVPGKKPPPGPTIQLWQVSTGECFRRLTADRGIITAAVFSADGEIMAAITEDSTIHLWRVGTGKHIRRLTGPRRHGSFVTFSPDGKILAAGSREETYQLFEAATGKSLGRCKAPVPSESGGLVFVRGKARAWGIDGHAVRVWEVPKGKLLGPRQGHPRNVYWARFSPDGKQLFTTSRGGTVCQWEVATGKELRRIPVRDNRWANTLVQQSGTIFAFSPNAKYLAAETASAEFQVIDLATRKNVWPAKQRFTLSDRGQIAFSTDSTQLALEEHTAESKTWKITIWDLKTWKKLRGLGVTRGPAFHMALSPRGKVLATVLHYSEPGDSDKKVNELRLQDVATGKLLWRVKERKVDFSFPTFSPDGKLLATFEPQTLRLWDVAKGEELLLVSKQNTYFRSLVGFSRDGKTIAAYVDAGQSINTPNARHKVIFLDTTSGNVRAEFTSDEPRFWPLALSPDGKRLATGNPDTTVMVWDLDQYVRKGRPQKTRFSPR
jgi:WD40 repeat protein